MVPTAPLPEVRAPVQEIGLSINILLEFMEILLVYLIPGSKVNQVGNIVYKVHRAQGEEPLSEADVLKKRSL